MDLRNYDTEILSWKEMDELRTICSEWMDGEGDSIWQLWYDYMFHDDPTHENAPKGFTYGPVPAWKVKLAFEKIKPQRPEWKAQVARAIELVTMVAQHEAIIAALDEVVRIAHKNDFGYCAMQRLLVERMDAYSPDWR